MLTGVQPHDKSDAHPEGSERPNVDTKHSPCTPTEPSLARKSSEGSARPGQCGRAAQGFCFHVHAPWWRLEGRAHAGRGKGKERKKGEEEKRPTFVSRADANSPTAKLVSSSSSESASSLTTVAMVASFSTSAQPAYNRGAAHLYQVKILNFRSKPARVWR